MSRGKASKAAESKRDREERQTRDDALAKKIRAGMSDRELSGSYDLAEIRKMRKAMAEHGKLLAENERQGTLF